MQTADDRVKQQYPAPFVAKSRRHRVRTALDFPEEPLHDIVGANGLPMLLGKGVEGQTGLEIALQTRICRWIDGSALFNKGCYGLISRLPILLIEQGVKVSLDLASGLFCYVPLHKIRYGITFIASRMVASLCLR